MQNLFIICTRSNIFFINLSYDYTITSHNWSVVVLRLGVEIEFYERTTSFYLYKKKHRAPDRLPEREFRMSLVAVRQPAGQHGRHPPRPLRRRWNAAYVGSTGPVRSRRGSRLAGGRDRGAAHRGVSEDHDVAVGGGGRWRQRLWRGRRQAAERNLRWGQLKFWNWCLKKDWKFSDWGLFFIRLLVAVLFSYIQKHLTQLGFFVYFWILFKR